MALGKYFRQNFCKFQSIASLAISAIFFFPGIVFASDMGSVMCMAADMVTGEIAAGIATIGVCTLGASACFGKISWSTAVMVGTGIAGLFGAASIAANFGATQSC